MILTLGRDSSYSYSYLICLDSSVNEATVLRRARVKPGTYAGDLLAAVHDDIFRRSLDLKYDYSEYYAIEYSTFAEYVHKRLLLTPEMVRKISSQYLRSRQIIYYQPGHCFLEGAYGHDFLERLLSPRGRK